MTGPVESAQPPTFETEKCGTCPADIIWAKTVRGRDMPVDAKPGRGGNLRVYRDPAGVVRADVVKPTLAFGRGDLYLSHFVKCKDAAKWRRR